MEDQTLILKLQVFRNFSSNWFHRFYVLVTLPSTDCVRVLFGCGLYKVSGAQILLPGTELAGIIFGFTEFKKGNFTLFWGEIKASRGTGELLYIDQHILNESKTRQKNLAMAWIDHKKAYNMILQSWINTVSKCTKYQRKS